jgi:[ribosomal protein S5]-alanine N-acetyltransferase
MATDPASSGPPLALPFRTERLTIRPLRPSDFEAMHAVYSDPEAMRFIPGGVRDEEGTRRRVGELIAHHDRHGVSKWAVIHTDSDLLIGDCGLQFLPGRPELELGFHFARGYWGYGYATEAASVCLAWALAERTERVIAIVDPMHRSSQRILTKLGMRVAGYERLLGHDWLVYEASRERAPGGTRRPAMC